ncbi:hypothetical protein BABINDRAFT_159106 [Babjeviella inositovora NRRL Y-12698]|uniref:N-acetyltransferase domain-containing protein n=1 Tax=Babjeviella inositovora NRRL Y-12698 TaxID=984486 RepID=A0A1E3QY07_9ASCO|nr:uncharacterized protein BABINDRAFT_159106 [Babjeviella inositovora NRRL Y-12698]ODQ82538.1 hypothetical protein BABINDRAFT_159106 [Babjeviella inositovora NRRL Y-12698]
MARKLISLDDLTPNCLGVLKTINSVVLPTSYTAEWYQESLEAGELVKLAYYSEIPVGAIKAKQVYSSNTSKPSTVPTGVYIESFAVLPAYQQKGVGSALLENLEAETAKRFIHELIAHVWCENTAGVAWYELKGFIKKDEVEKGYYEAQGLKNPDAYVMVKKI